MSRAKFQAVLFDMDGVVLDSMGRHAACWGELLREKGFPVDNEFILRHEGCLKPEVFCELTVDGGQLTSAESAQLMSELLPIQAKMYIERYGSEVRPFPEALEIIRLIATNNTPMALVTSSSRPVVESSLGAEIYGTFNRVITADDVMAHKPDPEPYLAAAAALGVEPEHCLVIENSPAGIMAANAAGATCYALTTTLAPAHLGQAARVFDSHIALARYAGLI